MAKIRSTKSETRNKSEIPNPNDQNGCRRYCSTDVLDFDFRSFDIVSYFDIRISNLIAVLLRIFPGLAGIFLASGDNTDHNTAGTNETMQL